MTPEQLKASILQMAIQGKLVEQRPEEGTSDEYLDRVGELLNIKRRIIEDEEKYIDIPLSWSWSCISDLTTDEYVNDGNWVLSKDMVVEGDVKLIQLGSIGNNQYKNKGFKYLTHEHFQELNGRQIYPGYLLVNRLIGEKMLSCILPEIEGILMTAVDVCWIAPHEECYNLKFLMYALSSSLFQEKVKELGRGTTRFRISKLNLINIAFPLPPLEEQHRIVAKIEELLPFVDRYAEAYEKLEKFNAKFPEDMKKSILQYAIMGKLVEQRAEEGTAEELYQQIQEEKQELIAEKKIKKEKPLAEITEDEIPFDIPESWKWCYLGEIFSHTAGKALNSKNTQGSKHKYITTSNVYWDHFELENLKEMYYTDDEIEKYSVRYGDMLVLEGGDIGRTAIWNLDESYCIQNHIHRLRPYIEICVKYFYHVMMYLKLTGGIAGKGIAIQGLSANALHSIKVPLPPLEEQKRIVAKIEELLPYCDQLIK